MTLRVVDLFCGAGGASCGMYQAGAELVAGVDHNAEALETHAHNLPGEHIQHDLKHVRPDLLPPVRIDWVHGSPPCQGFSQAKGERDAEDARNQLVWRFIDWVEHIQPKVVTMENVAGMQSISSTFMDRVTGAFREAGYEARWKKLNCADYGVPQTRERIFFVAVRDDVPTPSRWFPEPTHAKTRTTTLDGRTLGEWRTVRDAIADLARDIPAGANITSQQNEKYQKEGRSPMDTVETPAATIRGGTTPEVETDGGVANHVAQQHEESTKERFAQLEWGEQRNGMSQRRLHPERPSPTICASPGAAVPPVHYKGPVKNHVPAEHDEETREWMASLPLEYTGDSVTTRRLHPEEPAGTITGSSSTPPVHYGGPVPYGVQENPSCTVTSRGQLRERGHHDSISDDDVRRLTVREAARLQSFDDWFVFKGSKTSQLEQVGNAVPPRLQQHMTEHVRTILEGYSGTLAGSDDLGNGDAE